MWQSSDQNVQSQKYVWPFPAEKQPNLTDILSNNSWITKMAHWAELSQSLTTLILNYMSMWTYPVPKNISLGKHHLKATTYSTTHMQNFKDNVINLEEDKLI